MRRHFRITALLLALILLVGTLAGCASTDTPLNYLKKALENTVKERFGGEYLAAVAEALNGGLVELRYGGAAPQIVDTPLQAAELKLWLDPSEQRLTAAGSATVADKTYDGRIFFDRDSLVVSSSSFLAMKNLGINFDTLSADLEKSIFRNDSGSPYLVPWIGENATRDILALRDGFFTVLSHLEEWTLVADDVIEGFLECLVGNLGDEWYSKDGRVYINVSITNEVLAKTLNDLYRRLVDDGSFCRELRRIAETLDAMDSARQGRGIKVTVRTDRVEDFLRSGNTVSRWSHAVANDWTPFRLDLKGVIGSDDLIESLSVALHTDEDRDRTFSHVFTVGLDLQKEDVNLLSLSCGAYTRTLTYAVESNGLWEYKADLGYVKSISATGEEVLRVSGELNADRSTDQYELILVNGGETRRFTGSFDKKIDGFTVSVDSVTVNGAPHRCSLYLGVDVDGSPEAIPEDYELLFNLDSTDFEPTYNRAANALAELKRDWGDAPLTPVSWLNRVFYALGIDEEIS